MSVSEYPRSFPQIHHDFLKMATPFFPGSVVGTIPSPRALAAALKLRRNEVDFLELRVDAFAENTDLEAMEKNLRRLRAPLIVTVRHPLEGGAGRLTLAQRKALFFRFLPYVSFVDVELRSVLPLREVIAQARTQGVGVILSHHDFRRTPSLARLQALRRKAAGAGCDVFKMAAEARTARDMGVLLDWLTSSRASVPALAVMGMGEFGKVSRLVLAQAGSVLNYGYLEKPQVSGQWPAVLLKERLREIAGS